MNLLEKIYPGCFRHVGEHVWQKLIVLYHSDSDPTGFPEHVAQQLVCAELPVYLAELACLERAYWRVSSKIASIPQIVVQLQVNPSLELLQLSWQLLVELEREPDSPPVTPHPEAGWALIWRAHEADEVQFQRATQEDLLALKIVAEAINPQAAAKANQVSIGVVDRVINKALHKGILLSPPSRLQRNPECFSPKNPVPEQFLTANVFSFQWHITNVCDLHCKHCYDRTQRSPLTLDNALVVLDDLYEFCKARFVSGHVCFTGGNPFLYPQFVELYRAAAERGFNLSILGNPTNREQIEELLTIQPPRFFQLSLEGTKEHNDQIRGPGHYDRVLAYLALLKELGVTSSIMLTLTKDNVDQVLPLTEQLQGLTDSFTFNRLSKTGEGTKLELPDREVFAAFLSAYAEATKHNPILHCKDNLFNILRYKNGEELLDGCTGYGCGAAFNFLAVLPDGEVHACRKFPSYLGNILKQKTAEIYDSIDAQKYRNGCRACHGCAIRHVCGGCLAISYSFGQDFFSERDPYCFFTELS